MELAVSKGNYMIPLCEKIGEGGMERKKVNDGGAPGVSPDCCSPQHGLPTMLVEGRVSESLMSDAWSQKMSNSLQSVL